MPKRSARNEFNSLSKASEYDPAGHFQGWAFKIARFQVMKQITKIKGVNYTLIMKSLKT